MALSLDVTRAQQVDTRYSTQTQKFWSYSNLTRTKHYSDRVVSSINSRNFRIISTIIQKQPVMEKIFQYDYSKSGYFLFNTFPFYLSWNTIPRQSLNYFSILSITILTKWQLMMMTSKITLSTTATATR